jgi:hypothetical protein
MVLARLDHQIKVRGVRVEPDEVSAVLSRHPQVQACAVVARKTGPHSPALIAYVVGNRDDMSAATLRAYLAERLPAPLVPSAFGFLDRLPLTPNGKLDRSALPAPEECQGDPTQTYVAPRTPIEELLTGIWAEVLHRDRIGIEDNFFELGGHSLLATLVVARIRDIVDVELPLRSLFQAPTVATLAVNVTRCLLEARQAGGAIEAVPTGRRA